MIHPCYGIFYVKKRSACMGIEGSPRYMFKGKKKKKKIGKVQNAVKSKISLVLIKNECMALHAHEMI